MSLKLLARAPGASSTSQQGPWSGGQSKGVADAQPKQRTRRPAIRLLTQTGAANEVDAKGAIRSSASIEYPRPQQQGVMP
jgi:hypothetical protein